MPYPQFCATPYAPASHSRLPDKIPNLWGDIACRFAGLPDTYSIKKSEDLSELAADPVGFAADLAGLSRAEYLRLLAGDTSHE